MKKFIITEDADQRFDVVLNNKRVVLRLWYNRMTERWDLSVYNGTEPLILGKRVIAGVDLVRGYGLDIGSIFALGEGQGRNAFTSGELALYHATSEEIEEALANV